MRSFRLFNRQTLGYVVAVSGILLGAFAPALAMAAQVTERSIALSSSSASASNVSYTVNFTAATTAGAFVVDFCENSPVSGETCTAPTGFVAKSATAATAGYTANATTADLNNQVEVTATADFLADADVSVELTGIQNPTSATTMYARITTYDTGTNALTYTSTDLKTGSKDTGSVVIPITSTIGVSGAVLETMTFCIAGEAIPADCDLTGLAAPTVSLGEDAGNGVLALTPTAVSTGSIFTQLSTNAANGAIINLKSSALGCGGLINSSEPTGCYIAPALVGGVAANSAVFGIKTTTATETGLSAGGVLIPLGNYNTSTYALNYTAGDATGVTSTYGDPLLTTSGLPANNKNMELIFGASVTNATPAGNYSADLGLIATGKF